MWTCCFQPRGAIETVVGGSNFSLDKSKPIGKQASIPSYRVKKPQVGVATLNGWTHVLYREAIKVIKYTQEGYLKCIGEYAYGLQVKANGSRRVVGIPALLDDHEFVEAVDDEQHTGWKNPGTGYFQVPVTKELETIRGISLTGKRNYPGCSNINSRFLITCT